MGEYNKDQGQQDQTGQQGEKPAFGQFDKGENQQDQAELGRRGEEELTGTEGKEGAQQGDNQEINQKGQQGDNQAR